MRFALLCFLRLVELPMRAVRLHLPSCPGWVDPWRLNVVIGDLCLKGMGTRVSLF